MISGMSLRRNSIAYERPPSRRSGASSRRSSISVSRSRPTSQGHTPTRRLSDHLTIRRRRRSSTGIVYDAGYVGPVTRGFLQAFSRALLQDKNHESPGDVVYKALDEQHQRQLTSPAELVNEFDYSLPLPSDDVMMSPYQPSESEIQPKHDTPHDTPQDKPVFKSYLERILDSKNKHQNQVLSMFDRESYNDLTSNGVNAVINTSKFVIENTLSGLPEYSSTHDMLSLDLRLAEPVAFGNLSEGSDSNDSSEKENRKSATTLSRRQSYLEDAIITPTNYGDFLPGKIDQLDIPRWDSVLFDPSKVVTPIMHIGPFNDDLNENLDSDFSDLAANGLILGHFTIDNDEIQVNAFQLQPGLSVDIDEEEVHDIPAALSEETQAPSARQSLTIKRSHPVEERGVLPKSLVRGLVSVARHVPDQRDAHQSPPRKKTRNGNIPPSLMKLITSKSNQFLQQVMLDLEAYAGHRNSTQISIQDAVLYLNRIKSHQPLTSTIDNLSVLAQAIFPLELLVSLDNSLQESANKRLLQQQDNTDYEAEHLLYLKLSSESAQETDSLKSDDNLADLDWEQ